MESTMRMSKPRVMTGLLCSSLTAALLTGFTPLASATQPVQPVGISAASIAETKAIAEEGFIYGLPIVMNYAVMHAYAVD